MSRLTGADAYGLMEAYQAVYAPQELTEEQVWEGVENWVHSLLEEGYDLSDYTWEEMYEGYITEILGMPGAQNAGTKVRELGGAIVNKGVSDVSNLARRTADVAGAYGQGFAGQKTTSSNPLAKGYNAASRFMSAPARAVTSFGSGVLGVGGQSNSKIVANPQKPKISADRPQSRFADARDAAFEKAKQIKGSPVLGPKIVGSGTSPTPARPAASATSSSPATTAPASKPAAAKTTTPEKPMGGDPMDQWARANPTLAAKVKPGQSGYNTIRTRLDADNDRQENYDAYDLVLYHLINEGYADTQEAALAIMGNMSEEWSQSIISEGPNYDKNRQRAAQRAAARNAARDAGKTGNVPGVGYVTSRRERETYRDAAGVERHTSGARMPKKDEGDN